MSSEWKARRFWKTASIRQTPAGHEVTLDDRPLRTPGMSSLALPTAALAQAIAAEWDAQSDLIDPGTMPMTRSANSAIEKVTPQFHDVALMLAEYGGTDLLCYRAEAPATLVALQAQAWDPLIAWAATALNAPLRITRGVIPVPQEPAALMNMQAQVRALDCFGLTALHDLVTLPGSLVLGLAVIQGRIDADQAHAISRIDDEYQADTWGRDEDADAAAAGRLQAMRHAQRFWALSRPD